MLLKLKNFAGVGCLLMRIAAVTDTLECGFNENNCVMNIPWKKSKLIALKLFQKLPNFACCPA